MFNRLQTQEALKNPAINQQRLDQYQSPMSPNPQVRPDDAQAEEVRRAQLVQGAMGQNVAAMGDPKQTPTVMAKTMMENAQLKQMLAAMQQRQQPMQAPRPAGLESLPAPAVERGYAGGGIVAFDDGGKVERYSSQGVVMPSRYKRTEFFDLFGRNERLGGSVAFDEEKLREDEQELARIKSGLESGSITNPAALGKLAALERDVQAGRSFLAQRNAPQTQAPSAAQRPPSVGDVAALGLDRGIPAAARQRQQQQQQQQQSGIASVAPPSVAEPTATSLDMPSPEASPPSAGLLGELQRMAEQQRQPSQQQPATAAAPSNRLDRIKQAAKEHEELRTALGISGKGGDELRTQMEEMKAAQEKYKGQSGLLGLAQTLAAFGSAPRKRALGAAAQTGSQFMTSQEETRRKFDMEMAAFKAAASRADRAEKLGQFDTALKADSEAQQHAERMKLLERELAVRQSEGKAERDLKAGEGELDRKAKEKLLNLEIKSRFDLEKLSNATKLQIANMPPDTVRLIDAIAQRTGKSWDKALETYLAKGKQEVTAADRARFIAAYNDLPRSERAKYNDVEDFINQMSGGAGGMPSGVTVKKKD
jgi:hypothetical protein